MLSAFDSHIVVLRGDYTGLAFVNTRSSARPISFQSRGLVSSEGELSDLKFSAPSKTGDVRVVRNRTCE